MTAVLTGFSKYRNRLGTIYSNGTLPDYVTGVNVYGDVTVDPPAIPTEGAVIEINNIGPDVVTVTDITTIDPGTSIVIYWGGASWGWALVDCSDGSIPATSDQGTTQYAGPSETAYTVPQTTISTSLLCYLPCGTAVQKHVTLTYSQRSDTSLNKYYISGWASGSAYNLYAWGGGVDYYSGAPTGPGSAAVVAWGLANPAYAADSATGYAALAAAIYASAPTGAYSSSFDEICYKIGQGVIGTQAVLTYAFYQYIAGTFKFNAVDKYNIAGGSPIELFYLDVNETWTYSTV